MNVKVYDMSHVASTFSGTVYNGVQDHRAVIIKEPFALIISRSGLTDTVMHKIIAKYKSDTSIQFVHIPLKEFKEHAVPVDDVEFKTFLQTSDETRILHIFQRIDQIGLDSRDYMFDRAPKKKKTVGRPALGIGPMKKITAEITEKMFKRIPTPRSEFVRAAIEEKLAKETTNE